MPYAVPMTCPECHTVQVQLSTHLRRNCMKLCFEADIRAALLRAKEAVRAVVSHGVAIHYRELVAYGCTESVVPFLEIRGYLVLDKPSEYMDWGPAEPSPEAEDESEPEEPPPEPRPGQPADPASGPESPGTDGPDSPPPFSEGAPSEPVRPACAVDDPDEATAETLDERTKKVLQTRWTVATRKKMLEAGLYKRHSLSDPLLVGFAEYLRGTLGVRKYQQEVEDVARFLYYMNPESTSLSFTEDIEKVHRFFTTLRDLRLSNNTSSNYLKHVRRFVTFQMRATNLAAQQPQLFQAARYFMTVTVDIQKRLARGIQTETVGKRYLGLSRSDVSPADCQKLLTVAKPAFLRSLRAAREGQAGPEDHLEILYYLQALLVLRHLQRPGVVRNMTVVEWNQRIPHTYDGESLKIVGVKMHKTSSKQVATFVLNAEEESWFQLYFQKVRCSVENRDSPENTFFLSSTGREIYNVSNDIRRYHRKYHLRDISSQLVRKVCETWTLARYDDVEKGLFARYLAHSNSTAERNYREKTLADICHSYRLVSEISAPQNPSLPTDSLSRPEGQCLQDDPGETSGATPTRTVPLCRLRSSRADLPPTGTAGRRTFPVVMLNRVQ